jgi:hypothetical protein
MLLNNGFTAAGQIHLDDSQIGTINLTGAKLNNSGGAALVARAMNVRFLLLGDGFSSHGSIVLTGTRAEVEIDLASADLENCPSIDLSYTHARVLDLRLAQPPEEIDLRHATVGVFADDPISWCSQMRLQNFRYDSFASGTEISSKRRIQWLRRNPEGYLPQPYEQLAAVYRQAGQDDDARRTLVAKLRHQRTTIGWARKAWNWLLFLIVGYGYRTWQAGLWILALLIIGGQILSSRFPAEVVATKQPSPPFYPYAYAADLLIPVLNMGQRSSWQLHGIAAYCSWALIVAGWVLTTAVVAGLARILRRD